MNTQQPEHIKRITRNRRVMLTIILAHIVAGALLSLWVTRWLDREMRTDLLRQTQLLAEVINVDRLRNLSGTEADIEKPEYRRFKQQLTAASQARDTCRFVYLMGRNDQGDLFVLVDSLPPDFPDAAAAPGRLYAHAPEEFKQVFETGTGTVAGPFKDFRENFISGCVPVIDHTGAVIALLAMDFDTWEWRFGLAPAVLPFAILTLLLFAILTIGASLSYFRAGIYPDIPRWMRYLELMLVMEVGLTLTVFFGWTAHLHERHRQQSAFAQLAADRTLAISQTMRSLRDTELEGLGRFIEHHNHITPEAFYGYSAHLTRSRIVQGWGWVPAVPEQNRVRFEQAVRAQGLADFSIWQQDALGNRQPALGRDVYYPVMLITPRDINAYAVGFDLGSEPVRRAAIHEARRSGLTTGSEPITLIQDNADFLALLILRPVFDQEFPGSLRGFAMAFLRVEKLIESAGPDIATTRLAISLLHPDGSSEPLAESGPHSIFHRDDLSMIRTVSAFDKTFALKADPTRDFLRLHPTREGLYAAGLGIVLTAALMVIFGMTGRPQTAMPWTAETRTDRSAAAETRCAGCMSRPPAPRRRKRRVRRPGCPLRRNVS